MAVDPRLAIAAEPRVARFGATERQLHKVHAWAFTVLLLTGFVLYLPFLAQIVSDRPLVKGIHLVTAVAWLTALALVVLLGDRDALRRTRRDIERFDADDIMFVRNRGRAPAGRFNGGQKVHAILQAGLTVLFTVSGVLLWLGERNTEFRLPGTIALHDVATLLLAGLVAGHIMQATSHPQSLEGIRRGTVLASYAASHHPKWRPADAASARDAAPAGALPIALAIAVALAGIVVAVALV